MGQRGPGPLITPHKLNLAVRFRTGENMCLKLKTATFLSCLWVAIKKFYVASGFVFTRALRKELAGERG